MISRPKWRPLKRSSMLIMPVSLPRVAPLLANMLRLRHLHPSPLLEAVGGVGIHFFSRWRRPPQAEAPSPRWTITLLRRYFFFAAAFRCRALTAPDRAAGAPVFF